MMGVTPTVKRCPETRAHYAHEFYTPLRAQCPGGPEEAPECEVCGCWNPPNVPCKYESMHPPVGESDA